MARRPRGRRGRPGGRIEEDPEERPADTRELLAALDSCADAARWSPEDARRWWLEHAELAAGSAGGAGAMGPPSAAGDATPTVGIELEGSDPLR
jgi:hypothetical protein